jgi:hypothetical protein
LGENAGDVVKVLNPAYSQKRGRRDMFEKFQEQYPELVV